MEETTRREFLTQAAAAATIAALAESVIAQMFKSSQTFDGPHHRRQHGFRA